MDASQYVARVLRHAILAARFEEGLGAAVGTLRVAGGQRELDPAQLDVGRLERRLRTEARQVELRRVADQGAFWAV